MAVETVWWAINLIQNKYNKIAIIWCWYSRNLDTSAVEENSPKSGRPPKIVSALTIVVSPGPLSPVPSDASAMKTPVPLFPGPSVFLVEGEETPETTQRDAGAPKPAAAGDILMEHSSD